MPQPTLYHLIDLWISMTRLLHQHAEPKRQAHFGVHTPEMLLRAAVYLGTVEGRPMIATKLSSYVGIPRPTALRHLAALEARGLVVRDGRMFRTPEMLMRRRHRRDFSNVVKLIAAAHARLHDRAR